MKVKLWRLKGARNVEHWFLKRVDQPGRAHVIDPENASQCKLLAFLGLAKWGKGNVPELLEGEFEL